MPEPTNVTNTLLQETILQFLSTVPAERAQRWAANPAALAEALSVLATEDPPTEQPKPSPAIETPAPRRIIVIDTSTRVPLPPDGEIIELTIDGDDPRVHPEEMIRRFATDIPELKKRWQYIGTRIVGVHTARFEVITVAGSYTPDGARTGVQRRGNVPEGQWIIPLIEKYAIGKDQGLIGILDPSWIDCIKDVVFPGILLDGTPKFMHFGGHSYGCWRWLVKIP